MAIRSSLRGATRVWILFGSCLFVSFIFLPLKVGSQTASVSQPLPRIRVRADRAFITEKGKPFVPFGVTYYRPGTGWAPQVWKQFDAGATRADFKLMKSVGINCVRVFLSYGSFYRQPGVLDKEGLAKFDQFIELAEAAG